MRNVINIAARWLTSGFAVLVGIRLVMVGLLTFQLGSWAGVTVIALAFVFLMPALLTLFGGSMKWIRLLWGVMAVLGLAVWLFRGMHPTPSVLIASLVTLAISFGGRDKKAEQEEDVSAFS